MRWPQIRITLFEFVLAPESRADEQTGTYLGACTGGQFEIAQDASQGEEEEYEGFGFR